MKKKYFKGLGCATGLLIFIFFSFLFSSTSDNKEEEQVQYFEVTTKNGTFTLHTLMPKDSVKMVMGKPDDTNISVIGEFVLETYIYKKENYHNLEIEFENGKLRSVNSF